MKCFPFMRPVEGETCLLVGGGEVALRKAQKLLPFGVKIVVCAHDVRAELAAIAYDVWQEYEPSLLSHAAFAIAATDDAALNARVVCDCRRVGVPVNCVDERAACDFYFPALIVRGGVSIGISTGGASPALAAVLRRRIERMLPPDLDKIALRAEELRATMPAEEYMRAVEALVMGEEV